MNARAKLYWSLRRELWEHPSTWIAPLAVAGLVLLASLFSLRGAGDKLRLLLLLDAEKQAEAVATPFFLATSVIVLTSFLVALFYCLDALYAERRDRSILFWKSMPVSDLTTVASKVIMPLAVMPLVAFAIALATQAILLALSGIVLVAVGIEVGPMWAKLPFFQMIVVMLYGLVVYALWYAPLCGWLLLVSAWAKKAPFLWAVLPVFAVPIFERIAFGTSYVSALLKYRLMGAMDEAYVRAAKEPITQIAQLDPLRFLASPGLWIGLAVAGALLAAAIRMRRQRDPN